MNNTLEGNQWQNNEAEEWISDLEDRIVEINATRQNTEKRMEEKKEDSLRDLWDNIKHITVHFIGVPEAEER